jgi:hypothetical protein
LYGSIRGEVRTGRLRGFATGEARASRTRRRWTPYFRDNARTDRHDNNSVDQPWQHAVWITPEHQGVCGPAAFIQSDFTTGDHGNFEVVVPFTRPQGGVGLRQFWSDNSSGTLVWRSPEADDGASLDILHGIGEVACSASKSCDHELGVWRKPC